MKYLLSLLFLMSFMFNIKTYSQQKNYSFIKVDKGADNSNVYFGIVSVNENSGKKNLIKSIKSDSRVLDFQFVEDNMCKATIKAEMDANDFRKLLVSEGFDFDESTVRVSENQKVFKLPEDFPKKIDTGNPDSDEKDLVKRIKEWRKTHPEEWIEMQENRKNNSNK